MSETGILVFCAFGVFILGIKVGSWLRDMQWEDKGLEGARMATKRGLYNVTLDQRWK